MMALLVALASAGGDEGVKLDLSKNIPLLKENNFSDWLWRISAALQAIGVAASALTLANSGAHDTKWFSPTEDDQKVEDNADVKKAREAARKAKQDWDLAQGNNMDQKKQEYKAARDALMKERRKVAQTLADTAKQSLDPFAYLSDSQKEKAFRLLVTTLSPGMDFLIKQ
jgi:hypothetical protein